MTTRDPVTLLQQLMTERRWTRAETLKRLAARAPSVDADDFTLSLRQLDRMLAGQIETLPHAGTCRVIEAEFGRRIEDLLVFVDRTADPGMTMGKIPIGSRAPTPAFRNDRDDTASLDSGMTAFAAAAAESARFALWQGVDQLGVDTLILRLSQLAHDYVSTDMVPVVRSVRELRADAVELLPRAGAFGRELYFVAGVCSAVLAHAAGNLGHLDRSPWHVNAALRFAELGRHPVLAAWALGVQALQLEWTGHPARSLDALARAAHLQEGPVEPGTTAVWLAAIEARARARLGDALGTHCALDQVAFHRDQTANPTTSEFDVDNIGGILTFAEPKQHYYAATALRRIGRMPAAREHALAAIIGYEHGPPDLRSYGDETLARLDLAISYVADARPDLDAATEAVAHVGGLPRTMLLPTLRGHLHDLAEAASAPRLRDARQASQLRATVGDIAAVCRPRLPEVTAA